jgi:predicted NAD/FAD-dependent oxidoreductase
MRVRRLLPLSRLFLSTLAPVACNSFLLLRPGSSGVLSMSTSGGGGASSSTCKEDIERGPLGAGMTRSKVAVVGAGIAGSSLARTLADAGADVTVFEMGRGAGGRMSTRKPRDMPGLSINHGVPVFCAQKPAFMEFIEPLVAGGAIVNWKGTYCEIDAKTGGISQCEVPGGAERAFAGSPDMSSVCERLLDVDGITKKYQSQVVGMSKEDDKWALTGPKEVELGHFDWLCVTSHTMGHPRWTSVFGSEPPLTALAGSGVGDAEISQLVSPLASVASSPVMICMVSFSKQDEGARGASFKKIEGHAYRPQSCSCVKGDGAGMPLEILRHLLSTFDPDQGRIYPYRGWYK